MYSPQLLDHFQHPRNAGALESADAIAQQENPACGDVLKLSARVSGSRITEIRFQAKGCVPAIACGSALAEMVSGLGLDEAALVTKAKIVQHVAGLPPASGHAADLALATLAALLSQFRQSPATCPR